jgi:predicted GTPase
MLTPRNEAGYPYSSLAIGRLPKQAVVLIVGRSGDGKSKTINRLIGRPLLNMRGRGGGSTTKVKLTTFYLKRLMGVIHLCTGHTAGECANA